MKSNVVFQPTRPGKQDNILHVMRFLRPFFDGKISQRGGIAVAFEINYQTSTFVAGYSVCSLNDQFDYTRGRDIAADRLNKCEFVIEGPYVHALPLMTNFFNEVLKARQTGDILVDTIFKLSSNICSLLNCSDMYNDSNSYFLFAERDNNTFIIDRTWNIAHLRLHPNYGGLTLLYTIMDGVARYKIAGCSLKDQYVKKIGIRAALSSRIRECGASVEPSRHHNVPLILQDICFSQSSIPEFIKAYAFLYANEIYDAVGVIPDTTSAYETYRRAVKLARQINSL